MAFASRALTENESRYAQIEKELLALVYACHKFHDFIYGHPVTVETDHQPLITILKKPLHSASTRLNVIYKRGKELYLADALSRTHLPSTDWDESSEDYDVMTVEVLSSRRIEELRQETQADHLCRCSSEVVAVGWPDSSKKLPDDLRQFYAIRDELTVDNGLLLHSQRFVIPHSLQHLYQTAASRSPGPRSNIKKPCFDPAYTRTSNMKSPCALLVMPSDHTKQKSLFSCMICQTCHGTLTAANVFEWGGGHLVLVDSYFGWFEIDQLPNMTSATIITRLKRHFFTHGAPQLLMTDNATYFPSREFQEFARIWDFCHITSSPHYPQSNGLAERAVRTTKHLSEKCACDGTDLYAALLNLRKIPRDGLPSPAQRLLSRRTKTLISMTKAMYVPKVETQAGLTRTRQRGKTHYDRSASALASLQAGQIVRIQTDRGYDRLATVIGRALQPNSYQVQAGDATYVRNRRHLLHTPYNNRSPT